MQTYMKYLAAIKKTILYSAILHIFFLVVISLTEKDLRILNYFNILDLEYFFPAILDFPFSTIISFIIFAALFGVILHKDKSKDSGKAE